MAIVETFLTVCILLWFCKTKGYSRFFIKYCQGLIEILVSKLQCISSNVNKFNTSIDSLPTECLHLVFQYLSVRDLCHCSSVCQRWHLATRNSFLWQHVDFTQISNSSTSPSKRQIVSRQCKAYVNFILESNVRLSSLRFDVDLDREFSTLATLITSGKCRGLVSVDMRWADAWDMKIPWKFESQLIKYHSLMIILRENCPDIVHIRSQMFWTNDSLNYLFAFTRLKTLEINCVPAVQYIQTWHIDSLLQNLPNLRNLKLNARVLPDNTDFRIRSQSLEVLDISNTANFLITEMEAPRMHTFIAKYIKMYTTRRGRHDNANICLFDVIKRGCPNIKRINDTYAKTAGLDNFKLDPLQAWDLRICFCPNHCGRGRSNVLVYSN